MLCGMTTSLLPTNEEAEAGHMSHGAHWTSDAFPHALATYSPSMQRPQLRQMPVPGSNLSGGQRHCKGDVDPSLAVILPPVHGEH